jgi:hypothetical protein
MLEWYWWLFHCQAAEWIRRENIAKIFQAQQFFVFCQTAKHVRFSQDKKQLERAVLLPYAFQKRTKVIEHINLSPYRHLLSEIKRKLSLNQMQNQSSHQHVFKQQNGGTSYVPQSLEGHHNEREEGGTFENMTSGGLLIDDTGESAFRATVSQRMFYHKI